MVKLGFSLQAEYDCPLEQVIALLKEAGFSAVSPVWSPKLPMAELDELTKRHNMIIQSLHAPHGGIDRLWQPADPICAQTKSNIFSTVDTCAEYGIPIMVMHGWQGLIYTFPTEPLDFCAFDSIVDYAEQKGVKIAFENLEGEEYLAALMDRYRGRAHVGYCWDSGHDHCYPHKTDFLDSYGHRLIMTHINDNLGYRTPEDFPTPIDDLHFLPYDGNIEWPSELARLKGMPRQEILNFELKKRSASKAEKDLIYNSITAAEYIRKAGERAHRVADIYERIISE